MTIMRNKDGTEWLITTCTGRGIFCTPDEARELRDALNVEIGDDLLVRLETWKRENGEAYDVVVQSHLSQWEVSMFDHGAIENPEWDTFEGDSIAKVIRAALDEWEESVAVGAV